MSYMTTKAVYGSNSISIVGCNSPRVAKFKTQPRKYNDGLNRKTRRERDKKVQEVMREHLMAIAVEV
jgi:hypothetical protein